jgi:TIR domain
VTEEAGRRAERKGGNVVSVSSQSSPATPHAAGGAFRRDAFISYSSSDLKRVRRVHRFLQSYRQRNPDGTVRQVHVYLDQDDIRGGQLNQELEEALAEARVLIVCCSKAAADSVWVSREIEAYTSRRTDLKVAPVLLAGDPLAVIPPQLAAIDARYHDLRNGWILGFLRSKAKEELLRLLALVSNVDLRTLRNWHRRRTVARLLAAAALVILFVAAVLAIPLDDWKPMDIKADRGAPAYAIACGNREGHLWVGWRLRRPGPQGFRNYVALTDTTKAPGKFSTAERYYSQERLLPSDKVDFGVSEAARKAFGPEIWVRLLDRSGPKDPAFPPLWLGEPTKGKFVAVARRPPSQDAIDAQREAEEEFAIQNVHRMPPGTALVATFDGAKARLAQIAGLDPEWPLQTLLSGPDAAAEPPSPSNGLPIAWLQDGTLWLGMPARRDREKGGLWRSA